MQVFFFINIDSCFRLKLYLFFHKPEMIDGFDLTNTLILYCMKISRHENFAVI